MTRAAVILLLLTGAAEAQPSRYCQIGFGQIPHGICVLEQIRRESYGGWKVRTFARNRSR